MFRKLLFKLCALLISPGKKEFERPNFFGDNSVEFKELPSDEVFYKKCGHNCSKKVRFNLWGRIHMLNLWDNIVTDDMLCPECWFKKTKQSAIRCCLCGYAIIPGDEVALYLKTSKGIHKKIATFVGKSAVGCLRLDCCPSDGFWAGTWTENGFVSAFY